MRKIPFSLTMKFLVMLKKMKFDFNADYNFTNSVQLGLQLFEQIVLNIPNAQDEFLDVLNGLSGKTFDTESDTFEIIEEAKGQFEEIQTLFTQALKLKGSTT